MKRRSVLLLMVVASACQGSDSGPKRDQRGSASVFASAPTGPIDPAYARDIDRLCDVVSRSGAAAHDVNDRTFLTATWLGKNLETKDARQFLVKIGPLEGAAKADALDAEARRAGLARCPLADDWRGFKP